MPQNTDEVAINALLENYTRSVNTGDKALFESQLLAADIPFSNARDWADRDDNAGLECVQNYAKFRQGIFATGERIEQSFSNVEIRHDHAIAQVSLNFHTRFLDAQKEVKGWKVLHLIRLSGHWKIASELYTSYTPAP